MTAVLFECLRSAFPLPLQSGGCAGQLGGGRGKLLLVPFLCRAVHLQLTELHFIHLFI